MGGKNESVLPSDPKPTGSVLAPDPPVVPPVVPQWNSFTSMSDDPNINDMRRLSSNTPRQNQAIRQHMSGGQVHLHVDAPQPIKVAVPVAEWYVIMRHLRSLNTFTFVDAENKSVAYLRPYISGGLFEIAIELAPIQIGPRFNDMNAVTKR